MARSTSEPSLETMDDLLARLGGISPRRVLMRPPPGTATEADLLRVMLCDVARLAEAGCVGVRSSRSTGGEPGSGLERGGGK